MPKRITVVSLAASWLLTVATTAFAEEERGFYIGGNFGFTRTDTGTAEEEVANDIRALGFASVNVTIDETSTGFKLLGGYQINRNVAVEGYYANLGTYDVAIGTTGPATSVSGELEVTGVGVDLVGIIPFPGALSGFGKIGLFRWDAEATLTGPGGTASADDDGTDFKFGLGVQWRLSPNLHLRGEWELYNFDDSISMFSVGVLFRF